MKQKKDLSWFAPRRHADPLARVVLVEPLIPENTGNVSRTCVATGVEMHLVDPLGFELTESRVQRAGLDYWKDLAWDRHSSYEAWREQVPDKKRVFLIETSGDRTIYDAQFQRGDWLVFGKETSGLDQKIIADFDAVAWSIPMPGTTRSLNLSNSVAVVVFELLRQIRLAESRPTSS
jgi:tRNA (cytidine/uridine-2'-O-)-methyltransferase